MLKMLTKLFCKVLILNLLIYNSITSTKLLENLNRLKNAYPEYISEVSEEYVFWKDGSCMPVHDGILNKSLNEKFNTPSLADQMEQYYIKGEPEDILTYMPKDDPGRIRYEPFFRKMYGNSPAEVESNLEEICWMPRIFGNKAYKLKVTKINGVSEKLKNISKELEDLVFKNPKICIFLANPGGTYCWRMIANTNRLSNHSFGMTIDINANLSQYWQWDLKNSGHIINEDVELIYHNQIPYEIVLIFEKYGFIWGGKWYHYDTMHFEYRPELFIQLPSTI